MYSVLSFITDGTPYVFGVGDLYDSIMAYDVLKDKWNATGKSVSV